MKSGKKPINIKFLNYTVLVFALCAGFTVSNLFTQNVHAASSDTRKDRFLKKYDENLKSVPFAIRFAYQKKHTKNWTKTTYDQRYEFVKQWEEDSKERAIKEKERLKEERRELRQKYREQRDIDREEREKDRVRLAKKRERLKEKRDEARHLLKIKREEKKRQRELKRKRKTTSESDLHEKLEDTSIRKIFDFGNDENDR